MCIKHSVTYEMLLAIHWVRKHIFAFLQRHTEAPRAQETNPPSCSWWGNSPGILAQGCWPWTLNFTHSTSFHMRKPHQHHSFSVPSRLHDPFPLTKQEPPVASLFSACFPKANSTGIVKKTQHVLRRTSWQAQGHCGCPTFPGPCILGPLVSSRNRPWGQTQEGGGGPGRQFPSEPFTKKLSLCSTLQGCSVLNPVWEPRELTSPLPREGGSEGQWRLGLGKENDQAEVLSPPLTRCGTLGRFFHFLLYSSVSLCREDGAIILLFQVVLGVCVCVPQVFINEIQSTFQKSQSIKCCFFSLGVPVCHGHYHAEHTFHF